MVGFQVVSATCLTCPVTCDDGMFRRSRGRDLSIRLGYYLGYAVHPALQDCAQGDGGMIRAATTLILLLLTAEVGTETIEVGDHGVVDLATFECRDINRSSIIQRVCYDKAKGSLIVSINGVYDQYCDLPASTFEGLTGAPSMGQFFNRNIRGSGSDGAYHCRTGQFSK
jgi:hypothetical protein